MRFYRSVVETREMLRSAVKIMDWVAGMEDRCPLLRICEGCGRIFAPFRKDKMTCSKTCRDRIRQANWRANSDRTNGTGYRRKTKQRDSERRGDEMVKKLGTSENYSYNFRWTIRHKDGTQEHFRVRQCAHVSNKKDALAVEAAHKAALARGDVHPNDQWPPPKDATPPTLRAFTTDFLAHVKTNRTSGTHRFYKRRAWQAAGVLGARGRAARRDHHRND